MAGWSVDNGHHVGAVVARGKRVVSLGYNGLPQYLDHFYQEDRETKLKVVLHAEENAILFARGMASGCTLYTSLHPCAHCASLIIQSGILRVVAPKAEDVHSSLWSDNFKLAAEILMAAEIELDLI